MNPYDAVKVVCEELNGSYTDQHPWNECRFSNSILQSDAARMRLFTKDWSLFFDVDEVVCSPGKCLLRTKLGGGKPFLNVELDEDGFVGLGVHDSKGVHLLDISKKGGD